MIEKKDWTIFLDVIENTERQQLKREIYLFKREGGIYHKSKETHLLQLYSREKIEKELKTAGFQVKLLNGYGEGSFREKHIAFHAQKP